MQTLFQDRASIEKVRRLSDGRIAAVARFARSGVYQYTGSEVGRPDLARVAVYRPEAEVFSEDAMGSFAHRAITLDHPGENVSAANWKKVSVGYTEGRVARDGGFVEIPLMLADASAVAAFDSGSARELSAGYSCELTWQDGVAPGGEPYQAIQKQIRGNHIALVGAGRAGSECRIGDSMTNDAQAFADSAEGKYVVARAKASHHRREAHKGTSAVPWTDAMGLEAVSAELRQKAGTSRFESNDAELADAQRAADIARDIRHERLRNAWKG